MYRGMTDEFLRVLAMVKLKAVVDDALSKKKKKHIHGQYMAALEIAMKLKPSATKTRHIARIKLMLEVTRGSH